MSGAEVTQPVKRAASVEQLRAVYSVMRILAEDDRERGAPRSSTIDCTACRRGRPAVGSVDYAGQRLCNGCATDYELLRMAGVVDGVAAYLAKGPGRAAPKPERTA